MKSSHSYTYVGGGGHIKFSVSMKCLANGKDLNIPVALAVEKALKGEIRIKIRLRITPIWWISQSTLTSNIYILKQILTYNENVEVISS